MFGVDKVTDTLEGIFSADPVIMGEGDCQFLVGSDGEAKAKTCSWAYRNLPINEGDEYLVIISHPDKIATQAWAGQEVRVNECLS